MPSDAFGPRQPREFHDTPPLLEQLAEELADQFADNGWVDFMLMAHRLGWQKSQLNSVLRWMRKESPKYVVESRLFRDVARVRVFKVAVGEKHTRQLSAELVTLLAKLYVHLKYGERDRQKLASDVKTIASRISPFLADREFQIEYKKLVPKNYSSRGDQQLEKHIDREASFADAVLEPEQAKRSLSRESISQSPFYDHRSLPRLVFVALIIIIGAIVVIFFATTLIHALNVLSNYIEKITTQSNF